MRAYLLGRLVAAIPTLIGITILIFIAMRVLPGAPLAMVGGEGGAGTHHLSDEELRAARHSLGLDRPYYEKDLAWVGGGLRGNLGTSVWRGDPIIDTILRRGPITGQIALMAIVRSWLL